MKKKMIPTNVNGDLIYSLDVVAGYRGLKLLEYIIDVRVPTVEYWIAHGGRRIAHNAVVFLKKKFKNDRNDFI